MQPALQAIDFSSVHTTNKIKFLNLLGPMNYEAIASLCEALPGVQAETPFGPDTIVYKVGGKIFALLSLTVPRINLKCDPELAEQLRESYAAVQPGYHMNKKHWNSIYWEEEFLEFKLVKAWIQHSYSLVYASLPKSVQSAFL